MLSKQELTFSWPERIHSCVDFLIDSYFRLFKSHFSRNISIAFFSSRVQRCLPAPVAEVSATLQEHKLPSPSQDREHSRPASLRSDSVSSLLLPRRLPSFEVSLESSVKSAHTEAQFCPFPDTVASI